MLKGSNNKLCFTDIQSHKIQTNNFANFTQFFSCFLFSFLILNSYLCLRENLVLWEIFMFLGDSDRARKNE